MTPTFRTLKWLRDNGWEAQVVERWIIQAKRRVDLFGCIDIVATDGKVILGVQCTSDSNVAARVTKSKQEKRLKLWMKAGGHFWVIGWGKKGERNKRKTYQIRIVKLTEEHIHEVGGD